MTKISIARKRTTPAQLGMMIVNDLLSNFWLSYFIEYLLKMYGLRSLKTSKKIARSVLAT